MYFIFRRYRKVSVFFYKHFKGNLINHINKEFKSFVKILVIQIEIQTNISNTYSIT